MQHQFTIQDIPPEIIGTSQNSPAGIFGGNVSIGSNPYAGLNVPPPTQPIPKIVPKPTPKVIPKPVIPKPIPINYEQVLSKMGVGLINKPTDPNILRLTNEVIGKVSKGKKLDLKLNFYDKEFPVNNPLLGDERYTTSKAGGGGYYADKKQLDILADKDPELYKFRLAHEIGHTLGIPGDLEGEYLADAFARNLFPKNKTFFYKNNPYIKESWQKDYVPPNPLPVPKFPK